MPLNNVLSSAYRLDIVAECSLDNTLSVPWPFYDVNAGLVQNCGFDNETNFQSNSELNISTGQINGANTTSMLLRGASVSRTSPEPMRGAAASISYSPISIANVESVENLKFRRFKNKPLTLKAGGLINRGKTNEQDLDFSEFEPWFDGYVVGHDITPDSIDLTLGLKSDELLAKFPPRTYEIGESEGLAIPYTYGVCKGIPASIGDGLYQWHDGVVDLDVDAGLSNSERFPAIKLDGQNDYYHKMRLGSFLGGAVTGSTVTKSGIDWSIDSDTEASTFGAGGISAKCSDGLVFSAGDDNEVKVSLAEPETKSYKEHNFLWVGNDGVVKNTRGPDFKINIDGGANLVVDREFYIKINSGSGSPERIEILAPDGYLIKSCNLIVRSVHTDFQTAEDWDVEPDSITPEFGTEVTNHAVKYSSLNQDRIAFDYKSSLTERLCAIWFTDVEIYKKNTEQIALSFSDPSSDIEVGLFTSNSSQVLSATSPEYNSASIKSKGLSTFTVDDETKLISFDVDIGYGDFSFFINEITHDNSSDYGVDYDNGVLSISPPSKGGSTSSDLYGLFSGVESPSQVIASKAEYKIQFQARLVSSEVEQAFMTIGSVQGLYTFGKVFEDFKEYEYVVKTGPYGTSISEYDIAIATWRGDFTGKTSIATSNDDEDFTIEVKGLSVTPLGQLNSNGSISESEIPVYDDSGEQRVVIPSFQVQQASKYRNKLPLNIAVYDKNGFVCVSNKYRNISGKWKGSDSDIGLIESIRDISKQSTGVDHISYDGDSKRVGFMIKDQKRWIDHVEDKLSNTDHIYYENLTSSGITIKKRYGYNTFPNDFRISSDIVVNDSFAQVSQPDRLSQIVVRYNHDPIENKTKKIKSILGDPSKIEPHYIDSPYVNKTDNQELADLIYREKAHAEDWSGALMGIGHGLDLEDAGFIDDIDVTPFRACVITEITEEDAEVADMRKTLIKFRIYDDGAIHV